MAVSSYRGLYSGVIAILTILVLIGNLRLYTPTDEAVTRTIPADEIVPHLRFLGSELRAGAGTEMQRLFPEGFVFTNVLYGLSWCELARALPATDPRQADALAEATWSLRQLESDTGRRPFTAILEPPGGIFYAGWGNWLRGRILQCRPPDQRDPEIESRFQRECEEMARAFQHSPTPFLAAYPDQAWPVDSVVAIAALSLHDQLHPPRFQAVIAAWREQAEARYDPRTGLFPHRVDPMTGNCLQGARGSSQSLIQRFLPEIDPRWAAAQYLRFRRHFVTTWLGLPGVNEYPEGVSGYGDVDSGPLFFGISFSASAITAGVARAHHDRAVAAALTQLTEALGAPVSWGGERRYLFGWLPVGDAFIIWSRTIGPDPRLPAGPAFSALHSPRWRWGIHLISAVVLLGSWLPLLRGRLRRSRTGGRPSG